MNPTSALDSLMLDEHVRDNVETIKYLFGNFWWAFLIAAGLILYSNLLKALAAGVFWKMGRTYNEKDSVIVNGYYCAIAHIGFFFTEFIVYDKVFRPPDKGYSWIVPNERLGALDIWKKRPKHDEEHETIQTIHSVPKYNERSPSWTQSQSSLSSRRSSSSRRPKRRKS